MYYPLDNKLLDAYFGGKKDGFTEEERDLLQMEELCHYLRGIGRDLEYLLSLRFAEFWGLVSKTPEISRFLDDFLQHVRKHTEPIEPVQSQEVELRGTMNRVLKLVLQVFFRLSLTIEGDDEYFSLAFYQRIVYDGWLFDMAKLIDLAAVYSRSNPPVVARVVQNVFDNDSRFVQDFKETLDILLNLLRSRFKEFRKLQGIL